MRLGLKNKLKNMTFKKGLNVLSLFDGISCGQQAFKELNIKINNYYSSEIDETAILITKKNHQNTIFLGDVNNIEFKNYIGKIDLLIGGSPCQGFSNQGKMLGFEDPRSKLFFKFIEALNIIKPKYFLLENVRMKKDWIKIIDDLTGVKGVLISSKHFSAQDRKRYYWTNIPIDINLLPTNNLNWKDIICNDEELNKNRFLNEKNYNFFNNYSYNTNPLKSCLKRKDTDKIGTLLTTCHKKQPGGVILNINNKYRWININELELLQTLPINYTECEKITNNKRGFHIGNGWNIETIKWIFSFLKKEL
jgi:DNA-cytosine methyltransferase